MSEGQATAHKSGAPDPLLGRVIAGRFKITSLIARGGMGKVYRAEQAPLGRLCAVKVLNPNYNGDADPEFHRRFFREASITSKITHPNSVTIFDYGQTEDNIYFMAMEYLEGQTLHMALREQGVMNEIRVGRITSQICRAVREAHKLGVIHRDLKPANIFLTRPSSKAPDASGMIPPASEEDEDFVKVLDFGLVKHLSERPEEQLTQTGLFMGSPKYMAPEQIQGGHVDERTDIYSLGIIMYEMMAGKVPFERATSVNILMAHVGEPPPPMREVNPNLICSPAFEEIVMSCISKDPNQRFNNMDHLLAAIRRAHGGSLTGQVAAVNIGGANVSGLYTPQAGNSRPPQLTPSHPPFQAAPQAYHHTPPPAPYLSSPPGGPAQQMVVASGSHTPMGILRADASNDVATGTGAIAAKPRSKIWILFGVLVAAIIGGGLGMLAFQMTAPPPSPTAATSTSTTSAAPASTPTVSAAPSTAAATSVTPSASLSSAPPDKPVLKLTTDPPGASVREDNKEICAATPCELSFKEGEPTSKVHKLTITKLGFKAEQRTVKVTDPPMTLKLQHLGGGGGGAPLVNPAPLPPKPAPSSKPDSTPNGFKDAYDK